MLCGHLKSQVDRAPSPSVTYRREVCATRLSPEVNMGLGYDIFKKLRDGSPIWIMQAATLEDAKKGLQALLAAGPADYFIRDASSGEVLDLSDSLALGAQIGDESR